MKSKIQIISYFFQYLGKLARPFYFFFKYFDAIYINLDEFWEQEKLLLKRVRFKGPKPSPARSPALEEVHLIILLSKILLRQCDNWDPIVATMVTTMTIATMENLEIFYINMAAFLHSQKWKTKFDVLKWPKMDWKLKKCVKKCKKNPFFPFLVKIRQKLLNINFLKNNSK